LKENLKVCWTCGYVKKMEDVSESTLAGRAGVVLCKKAVAKTRMAVLHLWLTLNSHGLSRFEGSRWLCCTTGRHLPSESGHAKLGAEAFSSHWSKRESSPNGHRKIHLAAPCSRQSWDEVRISHTLRSYIADNSKC
jgi:hypothetical protein